MFVSADIGRGPKGRVDDFVARARIEGNLSSAACRGQEPAAGGGTEAGDPGVGGVVAGP